MTDDHPFILECHTHVFVRLSLRNGGGQRWGVSRLAQLMSM